MLLLNANVKLDTSVVLKSKGIDNDHKVFLVLQGNDLKENHVQINQDFIKKYPLFNTKLLIMMGNNASEAVKRIIPLIQATGKNMPSMISITSIATG